MSSKSDTFMVIAQVWLACAVLAPEGKVKTAALGAGLLAFMFAMLFLWRGK